MHAYFLGRWLQKSLNSTVSLNKRKLYQENSVIIIFEHQMFHTNCPELPFEMSFSIQIMCGVQCGTSVSELFLSIDLQRQERRQHFMPCLTF